MRSPLGGLLRPAVVLAATALLAACATRETRPDGAWLEEREAWFAAHPEWTISGRVGLSDGRRGGSLAFSWEARDDVHRIHLRTTTGGSQWRLHFSPGRAVLEGTDVGRLSAPDPDPLVEEAVGWPIPVRALSWWIRGLLPPEGGAIRFAEDGSLARVIDPVWTLDYQRFSLVEGQLLPVRLQAESDPHRVRLVIRDWRFGVEAD